MSKLKKIDWPLIILPITGVFTVSLILTLFPVQSHHDLTIVRSFLNGHFSFFYILVAIFFLCSTLYAAFSRYGKIKLGDLNDKPQYSNLHWGILVFTSTMSADIIFYSLCEWMMYAQEPFIKQKHNIFEWSLTYSLFHWGPIVWSFYIMLAVAFAYMLFVTKNKRQKFSEACRPLFGGLIDGIVGKLIDLIAVFALIAATASTFSMSMPLLATAVGNLVGIHNIRKLSLMLLIIVVLIYLTVSVIGMKAITKLSLICYTFFIGLMIYILLFSGSMDFILDSGIQATGNLLQNFVGMATTINSKGFTQDWTIYYWSYWIVWCVATPFFIGSISRGRTIKDVILRGYAWGLGGTYLSFIVLSNFGISRQIQHLVNAIGDVQSGKTYSQVIMKIMETLPQYRIAVILLILSMIGLYSTVFDSITMVVSKYSYRDLSIEEDPSKLMRGMWAVVFVMLPLSLLISNSSIYNIQSVAIIAAFPTAIIMILIVISFYKKSRNSLKNNEY
ncbi:BCCT family transporter [Lactobacillus reuteri]|uniref:BCCT family transporter n=1 Tax=Limosilactobacillus reuteri TaxID=1598 RepID=UPI00128E006D|nr:BCCT family transporter [Limosilactobacillus reuteri]MQB79600.1 BCCT family transporter [Limosilactobacillus reuteri]